MDSFDNVITMDMIKNIKGKKWMVIKFLEKKLF